MCGHILVERVSTDERRGFTLPFGYYLERDPGLLILRRSDSSFVAAFTAMDVDFFEVELTVWEDAD